MIYIGIAVLFYTTALICATLASRAINSTLVTGIMNLISALLPIALVVSTLNKKLIDHSKYGILLAALGGLAIAIFSIAMNKSLAVNKVAIVTPLVFGGTIFLSAILSTLIFKEKISLLQGIGLALLAVGLAFIIYSRYTGK